MQISVLLSATISFDQYLLQLGRVAALTADSGGVELMLDLVQHHFSYRLVSLLPPTPASALSFYARVAPQGP